MRSTPADLLALALILCVGALLMIAGVLLAMQPYEQSASISPMSNVSRYSATPISAVSTAAPPRHTTTDWSEAGNSGPWVRQPATAFVPVAHPTPRPVAVRSPCLGPIGMARCPNLPIPNTYHGSLGETGSANS